MRQTTQNHNGFNPTTQVRTSFLSHEKKRGSKLSGVGVRATECKDPNSLSFDVLPLNAPPFFVPDFLVMTQVATTLSAFQMARKKGGGICLPIKVLSGIAQDTPGGTYPPELGRTAMPSCEST